MVTNIHALKAHDNLMNWREHEGKDRVYIYSIWLQRLEIWTINARYFLFQL